MPEFRSIKDLEKALEPVVATILENKVAPAVKDVLENHIWNDVYQVYEPWEYERRLWNKGLIDRQNVKAEMIGNDTLKITNVAEPNPVYNPDTGYMDNPFPEDLSLAEMVEYGTNYKFGDIPPRPFIKNTIAELKKKKQHVKAMKEGLRYFGIKTEK